MFLSSTSSLANTRLLVRRAVSRSNYGDRAPVDDKDYITTTEEEDDNDNQMSTFTIVLYSGLVALLFVMAIVAYYMVNRSKKRALDKTWTTASTRSKVSLSPGTSGDATKSAEINAIERMKNVKLWRDTKMDTEQMILMQSTREKQRRAGVKSGDRKKISGEKSSLPATPTVSVKILGRSDLRRKKADDISNMTASATPGTSKVDAAAATFSAATLSMPTLTKDSFCKIKTLAKPLKNINNQRVVDRPRRTLAVPQKTVIGDSTKTTGNKQINRSPTTSKIIKKAR